MHTSNPIALITGASTGIGRSLAHVYAQKGYHLGLIARRGQLLEELKNEIQSLHPDCRVFVESVDVGEEGAQKKPISNLVSQLGGLSLFIANAGIGHATPGNHSGTLPHVMQMLKTNVLGAIEGLEVAKDIFLAQGYGHLVGVTSVASMRGLPQSSAYSASKMALASYLESIRIDLAPLGIKVTAIHPGFIETPMTQKNKSMPFLLGCDQSARMIARAIEKNKARYAFPWQMSLIWHVMRRLPDCLYDALMAFSSKKGVFSNEKEDYRKC